MDGVVMPGAASASISPSLSEAALRRAERVIPGASQTVSKGPTQWVAPLFAERAEGPYLWDVDGRRYFDLPLALGPILLGYAHPAVVSAIQEHAATGITFSLPHPLEAEVAERVVAAVPGAEMVRFGKAGSDATSAAVRAARAITGRDRVAFNGYHGWHDWHIGATSRSIGVPGAVRELTHQYVFNEIESLDRLLEAHPDEFAAIVVEPITLHEPAPGFLESVRERADAAGALLVFDEVVTGFRLALGGAQERYGVQADLVCLGKALANGMPLSAVAGPREHMTIFEEAFFSGTHGGEVLSLAAARATLDFLFEEDIYPELWRRGERLKQEVNDSARRHGLEGIVKATSAAPRCVVAAEEPDPDAGMLARTYLQQELLRRGVLFNGLNFICHAHTDADIEEIAGAYDEVIEGLADRWPGGISESLESPPLAPVFRRP